MALFRIPVPADRSCTNYAARTLKQGAGSSRLWLRGLVHWAHFGTPSADPRDRTGMRVGPSFPAIQIRWTGCVASPNPCWDHCRGVRGPSDTTP